MSVEVQWTDDDPETGERRFVRVTRFATRWTFEVRAKRREDWAAPPVVTREMWEELLDSLTRRYTRREGVTDADLATVRKEIARLRPPPTVERDGGLDEGEA